MTPKLKTLIEAAQKLSPLEQLNLINALSKSLCRSCEHAEPSADFWKALTLEQLTEAQQTQPITDITDLGAGFWPADESADDFIGYIHQQRCEDRSRDN